MKYAFDSSKYAGVFAVPSAVVTDHIRLAGAVQLKVLLWLLFRAPEYCSVDEMQKELGFAPDDINDAMQYWIVNGFVTSDTVVQNDNTIENQKEEIKAETKPAATDPFSNAAKTVNDKKAEPEKKKVQKARRPEIKQLTRAEAVSLGESNPEIKWLLGEAADKFGRLLSNSELSAIVSFYENDGLPAAVIVMILGYAASTSHMNIRYIDKIAANWSDLEIDTVEKAEVHLKQLESEARSWHTIESVFGLDRRKPSAKEQKYALLWVDEWGFSREMLKYTYDICVDCTGKLSLAYIDKILHKYHDKDVKTVAQAKALDDTYEGKGKAESKDGSKRTSSFDVNDIEQFVLKSGDRKAE